MSMIDQVELMLLDRYAQAIVAIRSARRVQPFIRHFWPQVDRSAEFAVERALNEAEHALHTHIATDQLEMLAGALSPSIADAGDAAPKAALAMSSAAHAVQATYYALTQVPVGLSSAEAYRAVYTACVRTVNELGTRQGSFLIDAGRADLIRFVHPDKLKDAFADLWSQGRPADWPVNQSHPQPLLSPAVGKDELRSLPRFARLAFCARIGRRLLPLMTRYAAHLPNALDEATLAVRTAEDYAAAPRGIPAVFDPLGRLDLHGSPGSRVVRPHGEAVARIAFVANLAASRVGQHGFEDETAKIIELLPRAAPDHLLRLQAAIASDYQLVSELARQLGWDDATPVSTALFGPLWGRVPQPEDWPPSLTEVSQTASKLVLQVALPADIPDEEADEAIIKLAEAASLMHIAQGGAGLVIRQVQVFEPAPVSTGTPP